MNKRERKEQGSKENSVARDLSNMSNTVQVRGETGPGPHSITASNHAKFHSMQQEYPTDQEVDVHRNCGETKEIDIVDLGASQSRTTSSLSLHNSASFSESSTSLGSLSSRSSSSASFGCTQGDVFSQEQQLEIDCFQFGKRSPKLFSFIEKSCEDTIPLSMVRVASELLIRNWESDLEPDGHRTLIVGREKQSIDRLTHKMALTIYNTRPSIVTFIAALLYISRMKQLNPGARGSHGCSHRLFTTALLLSLQYNEFKEYSAQSWCRQANLSRFTPKQIDSMRLDMLKFLGYNLWISYREFEYFYESVWSGRNDGQCVPGFFNLDLVRRKRVEGGGEDRIVPNFAN